ncbi:hypothetical protein [Thalassospira marina]|uniref:Uncharacterized protein n=1 Tax=Thalassospira marina TaxID=2048283 RepID=A0A2N3KJQ2_9PROT|nr:hypothetical protein [Thalassospira marina]PKR50771.1 hypothetical protein COO20_20250 [Thalassospira marina]
MSDWQTRSDLMVDLQNRIKVLIPNGNVVIGRLMEISADSLPAISIYAPTDDMSPMGASWQFSANISLSFEVLQSAYEGWCQATESLTVQIITGLCASAEWRGLWQAPPSFATKQTVRGDPGQSMAGEITTISGELRRKRVSRLVAGPLEGIDLTLERENESPD